MFVRRSLQLQAFLLLITGGVAQCWSTYVACRKSQIQRLVHQGASAGKDPPLSETLEGQCQSKETTAN